MTPEDIKVGGCYEIRQRREASHTSYVCQGVFPDPLTGARSARLQATRKGDYDPVVVVLADIDSVREVECP